MSFTVTVKEHDAEFDEASDTVQVTVVVPFGKLEPEGGVRAPTGDKYLIGTPRRTL